MPNHLSNENSLYLKQHANNPVDWWPWGPEAFEQAKKLNKPVLVSIGYSACHWCHVMAHESFEDPFIADIMNRNFICIKVDREERPDVDQIYMEAVQMITGRGGWPLNAFCFSDGRPFFGGTYFPPEDRGFGIIPWPQLLVRIVDFFKKSPHELEENANNILKNMAISNSPHVEEIQFSNNTLFSSAEKICHTHDDKWGGFGAAPKFPPSMTLDFLLATRNNSHCKKDLIHRIDTVITTTLTKMAYGGIYDQIGGGFARYSVDTEWRIPHFEKMLYDNALLIDIYTKAWAQYHNPLFKDIVQETIQWLFREMAIKHTPVFASSLAADSEGKEGKYYVWSLEEMKNILDQKRMNAFCNAYGVSSQGNFEKGLNQLTWVKESDRDRPSFASDRQKLLEARQTRIPPQRDDKVLTAWNSLLAHALIEAGFYFERNDWILHARELLDWIWKNLSNQKGQLHSVYYPETNTPAVPGFLDDYAFYAQACLTLASKIETIEKNASALYLERAQNILQAIITHFKDKDTTYPGYFFTSNTHGPLVAHKKLWLDNAIPCGNSALLHIFSSLYAITGDSIYTKEFQSLQEGYATLAMHTPNAVANALSALMNHLSGIIVIKFGPKASLEPIAKALRTKPYHPSSLLPDKSLKNNYQVCIGTHCLKPTHKIEGLFT